MDRVPSMLQSAAPALRGSRIPASSCQPYIKHPERWNQSIDVLQSDPEWMLIPQITALSWQQALQERGKPLEPDLDKPGLWANASRGADPLPPARKGLSLLPPPLRAHLTAPQPGDAGGHWSSTSLGWTRGEDPSGRWQQGAPTGSSAHQQGCAHLDEQQQDAKHLESCLTRIQQI